NRLSFYWMATLNQWQVYIDCVKIGSDSSRSANETTEIASTATKAPAATTKPVVKCNVKK
ncbi:Hypothetical protein PHPALM_15962, partial [Globisporangium polare]